jgi:hypothetical protein
MISLADFALLANAYSGANLSGLDYAPFYFKPYTMLIGDQRGVVALDYAGDGIYVWHWVLGPKARGRAGIELGRRAIKEVFTRPWVNAIKGVTPREFRAARVMNRALGARPIGESTDFAGRACIVYLLEREQCLSQPPLSVPESALLGP